MPGLSPNFELQARTIGLFNSSLCDSIILSTMRRFFGMLVFLFGIYLLTTHVGGLVVETFDTDPWLSILYSALGILLLPFGGLMLLLR